MTTTNPTIPDELSNIVYSLDFEEEGGFIIKSAQFSDEIIIDFSTHTGPLYDSNSISGEWRLILRDTAQYDIQHGWGNKFEYYDSHPLLLEYNEPEASLFYSSSTDNKDKLVTDIYNAHIEICIGYLEVEKFLNYNSLVAQCNNDHGLFASGPLPVIEAYKAVLDKYNMTNNILVHSVSNIEAQKSYFLLEIGRSSIIGKEFHFEKIR